jgi:hypothetical protein
MPRYKTVNGERIQFTAEEEAARDVVEQAWNNGAFDRSLSDLRSKRNNLLAETDWMANSDVTMSDDWKNYRTQLRDITEGLTTVEDVEAVVFPEKP